MRAKLQDKSVCPRCYGTGTEVVNAEGRYAYSRPCYHVPQRELPMDEEPEADEDNAHKAA